MKLLKIKKLTVCIPFFFFISAFGAGNTYIPCKKLTSYLKTPPEIFTFLDGFRDEYKMVIHPKVRKHEYNKDCFVLDGNTMKYIGDKNYTYRLGVDISRHDGDVDWQKVKESGRDFVFLRIGYRGYQSGILKVDERFHDNIKGAQEAGLDVGVYVFSQAINEEEALEEAELVIKELKDYSLQLPVVYDPESIRNDDARTDKVSGMQFTKNTITFCEKVKQHGFTPMIYSNMMWEAYFFDLSKLENYEIWYADYEPVPQTPYHFSFVQYSEKGTVPGVSRKCDLDVQLIPRNGVTKNKKKR